MNTECYDQNSYSIVFKKEGSGGLKMESFYHDLKKSISKK